MGFIFETAFVWLWGALLDSVGRAARPWVFALLLVGPLALVITLVWVLI